VIVADRLFDHAQGAPTRPAYGDAIRTIDFSNAAQAVERIGARFGEFGLRPRDRILIVSENDVATPLLMLGAQRIGAWPALANARSGAAELAALRACAQPRLVVFATDASPSAAGLAELEATQDWDDEACGAMRVAFDGGSDGGDTSASIALLLFTSGTTGRAKAVMWSHDGLAELGRVLAASRATMAGSVVQCAGPLSHIMGISNFMAALEAGATLQLMPRLDVAALATAIAAGEVTHLSLVPTAYQRLCDHLESRGVSLQGRGLRYISAGGAPLDPTLKQRVERLLGLRLVNGYGMTECAPGSRTRPDRDAPASCIGWPEAGVEMRVDGDDTGELLIRSVTRMVGYFGAAGDTAAIVRPDGWLATGDLARRLPDGSFELVGRKKEMIIRSGFNVYPAEVEAALNSLPAVSHSAVLGRKLDDGNEEVVAFVRLRDPGSIDAATLVREVGQSLAPYKRPSRIVLVDEFPLGPTGKILKHRLGAELKS
jgi:acyl-CoA synthetase (AMP-forming)/AMP-acid ligase II